MIEAQVEYRGTVSVGGPSYPDCVRVSYTTNGQLDSKWTYCFALGPVLIEQPTAAGMLQGELIGAMDARISMSLPYGNPNSCDLTFVLTGFDVGETVDVRLVHPDGNTTERTSVQIAKQGNEVKLKATAKDSPGAWLAYADGTRHRAMGVLRWEGRCG